MSDHVKRGALQIDNRDMDTEWEGSDDGRVNAVWMCQECDTPLEVHQRRGRDAYVSIECRCGAESLDLRIADIFDFDMETWDTEITAKLDWEAENE